MMHGRGHDERLQHARRLRASNVPVDEETEVEAEMAVTRRSGVRPRNGEIGATRHGTGGSDVGPTKLAAERERERHRLENEAGRVAAGEEETGEPHDLRTPGVTRERLREARHAADERVVGHEVDERTKR